MSSDIEIDGFEIEGEIGRGGFGVVFRARQVAFGRLAAVKVLLPDSGADEVARRFAQECRAVGSLRAHPNIVTVYSTGTSTDARPYLAMQYLGGGTLAGRVPLTAGAVAALGARLADGLGVAHTAGVIHRDVKPANILFDGDDEPVLVDFGISAVLGEGSATGADVALSVAYAPPEVLRGEAAGVAADIYALGATLFAAVTGRSPFANITGVTPIATLAGRILAHPVEDLRPAGVPDALCAVIEKCLAKDPTQRYTSMAELRAALLPIEGDAVLRSPAELWGMPTTTVGALDLPAGEYDDDKTSLRGGVPVAGGAARARGNVRRNRIAAVAAAAILLSGGIATAAVVNSGTGSVSGSPSSRAVADLGGPGGVASSGSSTTSRSAVAPASSVPIGRVAASSSGAASRASASAASRSAGPPVRSGAGAGHPSGHVPGTRGARPGSSAPARARNHAPALGSVPTIRSDERRVITTSISAADADGDALRFSASGLPAGLSISSSGTISGRIANSAARVTTSYANPKTQRFTVTVTVTDSHGAKTSRSATWYVRDTTTYMPDYHLKRGCNGSGSCHESVPNIVTLGPRTKVCRVNARPPGTILSQSVKAGTSISYGVTVRYVVAAKSC